MRFSTSLLLATAALLATTAATSYATGEWGIDGSAITNLKENSVLINITVINEGNSGFCELNNFLIGKFPIIDYKVFCKDSAYSLSLTWENFDSQLLATLGTPRSGLYQYDAQIYNRQKLVPYDKGCKFGFTNGPNGEAVFSGNQQTQTIDRRDADATSISISSFTRTLTVSIFVLQINNANFITIHVYDGNNNICTVLNRPYGSLDTISARPTPCVQFRQDGSSYQDGNQLGFKTNTQGVLVNVVILNSWNRAGNQFSVSDILEGSSNQQFRSYTVEYDNSAETAKRFFRA